MSRWVLVLTFGSSGRVTDDVSQLPLLCLLPPFGKKEALKYRVQHPFVFFLSAFFRHV